MTSTDTENVGVYIEATHGCMEHRGVMAHSSLTQTTVVHGLFHNDAVKSEFFNNVKNQMRHCQEEVMPGYFIYKEVEVRKKQLIIEINDS